MPNFAITEFSEVRTYAWAQGWPSGPVDEGLHRSPAGNNYSANVQTNQREDGVDSGPNPSERDAAADKQQREEKARGTKEQREREEEERLERKQIRQEEQEERQEVRQEEREERKRERQKARGQEESST
jgi:hypothetical protein